MKSEIRKPKPRKHGIYFEDTNVKFHFLFSIKAASRSFGRPKWNPGIKKRSSRLETPSQQVEWNILLLLV